MLNTTLGVVCSFLAHNAHTNQHAWTWCTLIRRGFFFFIFDSALSTHSIYFTFVARKSIRIFVQHIYYIVQTERRDNGMKRTIIAPDTIHSITSRAICVYIENNLIEFPTETLIFVLNFYTVESYKEIQRRIWCDEGRNPFVKFSVEFMR